MLINYQKGTHNTQHNKLVSVPQCSWPCSGLGSPASLWFKGHPASVSVGAVTLKRKCPCAMWQLIWQLLTRLIHHMCAHPFRRTFLLHLLSSTFRARRFFFLVQNCDTVHLPFQSRFIRMQRRELFFPNSLSLTTGQHSLKMPFSLNLIGSVNALLDGTAAHCQKIAKLQFSAGVHVRLCMSVGTSVWLSVQNFWLVRLYFCLYCLTRYQNST